MNDGREQIEDRFIQAEENLLIDTLFLVEEIMRTKKIDRKTLAEAMGVSKARLSQLLNPGSNPTLKSLARIFAALGEEVSFSQKRDLQAADIESHIGQWQASTRVAEETQRSDVGGWGRAKICSNDNHAPVHQELWVAAA